MLEVRIVDFHRGAYIGYFEPHVLSRATVNLRDSQIVETRSPQSCHAIQMPHMPFQMTCRQLDQSLQESSLHSPLVRTLPQCLPGLMRLPPIAMVVQISCQKVRIAQRPFLWSGQVDVWFGCARRPIAMPIRVRSGMGRFSRYESVRWKRRRRVSRERESVHQGRLIATGVPTKGWCFRGPLDFGPAARIPEHDQYGHSSMHRG